jgi:2-keto-4-pentenoate hydratase/2-oxohepta-3-ene-1,7-dioic acid hydratase in catechol pathway
MRVTRFAKINHEGNPAWGRIDGDSIVILKQAPWLGIAETSEKRRFDKLGLLAPAEATKVILVGLNYHEHIKESQSASKAPDEPVIFMKPITAIIGPNDEIPRYDFLERQDYEGELAAVIGKRLFRAGESEIRDGIFGYTCLNDVTARALQKKDVQWTRAKGFDGFCPVGPWITTDIDPTNLKIETRLNGEIRQSGTTADQIWNIFELTRFISNVMTLLPGDIISTGTPQGVGNMAPGDIVAITIEQIGTLENRVKPA